MMYGLQYFRGFATLILSWRPSGIHGKMIPARSSFSMTSPWSWNHEYGSQSLQCGYILDMHNDVMLPKLKVKSSHWVCCFVMRVCAWICCAFRVSNLKAIPRNIIGKRRALRCWFWSDFDSNKGMAQLIHRMHTTLDFQSFSRRHVLCQRQWLSDLTPYHPSNIKLPRFSHSCRITSTMLAGGFTCIFQDLICVLTWVDSVPVSRQGIRQIDGYQYTAINVTGLSHFGRTPNPVAANTPHNC